MNSRLFLYASLARWKVLQKSYISKIMVVAFLGTHIPLLTLLASFILSNTYSLETSLQILGVALVSTLLGTAATLFALRQLLAPVILTSAALQD